MMVALAVDTHAEDERFDLQAGGHDVYGYLEFHGKRASFSAQRLVQSEQGSGSANRLMQNPVNELDRCLS